jgi:hypothetical protein
VTKAEYYQLTAQDVITSGEDLCEKIALKYAETIDAFIFEVILPYCSEVERRTVTKEELIKALRLLREQEQKEQTHAES